MDDRWISVGDGLPSPGIKVLVCTSNGKISISQIDVSKWTGEHHWRGSLTFQESVMFWMNLPKAPETENSQNS